MSVRAMKAGAVEFLTKRFREQDLLDAIRGAIERERDVLGGIVASLLNKQVAELVRLASRLGITPRRSGDTLPK